MQKDLPELLSFFNFPQDLWRKLRTTNIIESCFMEVRRRTRHMVCFVNVESVDRIIYSIFQRFNLNWKNRTLKLFTQPAKITLSIQILEKRWILCYLESIVSIEGTRTSRVDLRSTAMFSDDF